MSSIHHRRVYNRVHHFCHHIPRFAFDTEKRLAEASGISESAVRRFLSGRANPSYAHVMSIIRVLEKELGITLNPADLVSLDESYPTATVCELVGCTGCTPLSVYESDDWDTYYPSTSLLTERPHDQEVR